MHRRAESGWALRGNEFNQTANFIVGHKYALPEWDVKCPVGEKACRPARTNGQLCFRRESPECRFWRRLGMHCLGTL